MSPSKGLPLAPVGTSCARCVRGAPLELHRHHLRHEAMWFGIWRWRDGQQRWEAFRARYHRFLSEDTITLCADCHLEIHRVYDRIIQQDREKLRKSLSRYTWNEADLLMDKLRRRCLRWLGQGT